VTLEVEAERTAGGQNLEFPFQLLPKARVFGFRLRNQISEA
jgi:hypothetical protein